MKHIGNPNRDWGWRGGVVPKRIGTHYRKTNKPTPYRFLISSLKDARPIEPEIDPLLLNCPHKEDNPERQLYAAILSRAIDDLRIFDAQAKEKIFYYEVYRNAVSADAWMSEKVMIVGHEPVVSFLECCEHIDIPPDSVFRSVAGLQPHKLRRSVCTVKAEVLNGAW